MDSPLESDIEARDRETLARAIGHPVRGKVLVALAERPDVTIRQVAERLDQSPRRVRHHVEALIADGLVQVTGEDQRRGVVERRYGRLEGSWIEESWHLSEEQQVRMATMVVRLVLSDIAVAARAGTFSSQADRCEARFYGEVDDECRRELAEIHLQAYRAIDEAISAGRARFRQNGAPGTEVISALFFLEAPLWGPTLARGERTSTRNGLPITDA